MPSTNLYDFDIDDYQEQEIDGKHHHQTINGTASNSTVNHQIHSLNIIKQQQNDYFSNNKNNDHHHQSNNNNNKHSLAVKVENIAYSYHKKKPVLKNVSLFVPEGKIFLKKIFLVEYLIS